MSASQDLAWNLEKFLISPSEWTEEVLSNFPKDVREELEDPSGPTGIGWTKPTGWFCVGSGQGPFVIWTEKEIDYDHLEATVLKELYPETPCILLMWETLNFESVQEHLYLIPEDKLSFIDKQALLNSNGYYANRNEEEPKGFQVVNHAICEDKECWSEDWASYGGVWAEYKTSTDNINKQVATHQAVISQIVICGAVL